MNYSIAIVGGTGNAGRTTIDVLEKRKFPVETLYVIASKKSAGKTLVFKKKKLKLKVLSLLILIKRI